MFGNKTIISGCSTDGSALALGARCRGFESSHPDQFYRGGLPCICITVNKCKPHRDFGCGFYLATNYFDALPMAVKNSRVGYVQTYLLTDLDGLSVLEFDERSEDWLRFVVSSRLGTAPNVDLVIGYMAGGGSNLKSKFTKLRNSNVSIDVAATAMRKELTSTQLGVQYAFLTEKALSKLVRVSTEIVEMED